MAVVAVCWRCGGRYRPDCYHYSLLYSRQLGVCGGRDHHSAVSIRLLIAGIGATGMTSLTISADSVKYLSVKRY